MLKRVNRSGALLCAQVPLHRGEHDLIDFMNACIERAEKESQSLPVSKGSMTDLNDFFLKTLE